MAIGNVNGILGSSWVPPIGFVWKSSDPTSPAELFDHTVWQSVKDCAILASGETYALNASGGSRESNLTEANLPPHSHTADLSTAGAHTHKVSLLRYRYNSSSGERREGGQAWIRLYNATTSSSGTHTHPMNIASAGEADVSVPVMNPYIVRYIWERIG